MTNAKNDFSSDGFDLDALASSVPSGVDNDVVFELGGKVSIKENLTKPPIDDKNPENEATHVLSVSENFKQEGNNAFLKQEWKQSYDLYTEAIVSVPYDDKAYTGEFLLKLKEDWEKHQFKLARQKLQEKDERERLQREKKNDEPKSSDKEKEDCETDNESNSEFVAPPHPYAENLSVYYCNRAAALLQLEQVELNVNKSTLPSGSAETNGSSSIDGETAKNPLLEKAVQDCTVAIYLKPDYTKALLRRSTARERMNQTDIALADSKKALLALQRQNIDRYGQQYKTVEQTVKRLQKLEDERLETLKAETLDKLKDLGNSILGNFGLSLDSFQAQQDPKTGSYNISFNNKTN